MARVHVDPAVCELHGQCVIMAPESFRFADDGSLEYDHDPVGSLVELAEDAAGVCPTGAITIDDLDHV